jgi:NADP-reducing hydrogenase subunit HndB
MPKLTIEELRLLREESKKRLFLREGDFRAKVTVHMGTCGIAAGAREIMAMLLEELEAKGVTDVMLTSSGCAGLCSKEPMVTVEIREHPPVKYGNLTPGIMRNVFEVHVMGGEILREHAIAIGSERVG